MLQRPPSKQLWEELCQLIDKTDDQQAREQFIPYIQSYLKRWPKDFERQVPDTWAVSLCHGDGPLKLALCDALHLDGEKPPNAIENLVECHYLTGLEHLCLADWTFTDHEIELLANALQCDSLKHLSIHRCELTDGQLALLCQQAQWLGQIQHLSLWGNQLTAEGLKQIAQTTSLSSLENLSLWDNDVTSEGLEALAEATHFKHLHILDFDDNLINDDGLVALAHARSIESITSLEIYENDVSFHGLEAICSSPIFSKLEVLNIRFNTKISPHGILALANSAMMASIEHLNIAGCHVDDDTLEALVMSPAFKGTKRLIAWSNQITDDGAQILANSPYVCDLDTLDLDLNKLTQEGRDALACSSYLAEEIRVTFEK